MQLCAPGFGACMFQVVLMPWVIVLLIRIPCPLSLLINWSLFCQVLGLGCLLLPGPIHLWYFFHYFHSEGWLYLKTKWVSCRQRKDVFCFLCHWIKQGLLTEEWKSFKLKLLLKYICRLVCLFHWLVGFSVHVLFLYYVSAILTLFGWSLLVRLELLPSAYSAGLVWWMRIILAYLCHGKFPFSINYGRQFMGKDIWHMRSFRTWRTLFQALLTFKVSVEKELFGWVFLYMWPVTIMLRPSIPFLLSL